MLIAAFCFAIMHAMIKALSGFHVFEIVFFRSSITAAVCIVFLRKRGISLLGNNKKLLLLRAFYGIMTMSIFFFTLQRMPMGAAVSLKYLSPFFTIIFAVWLLKEKVGLAQWMLFVLAVVGVFLLKGFDARIETLDFILAIVGAVFGGLVYIVIRQIGTSEHSMVIINYFMLSATILAGIGMIPFWRTPVGEEWLVILGVGVVGYFGQIYLTKSFQVEEVSKVAPIRYAEVIYSLLIGLFWFGESYTLLSGLGILLILVCMVVNVMIGVPREKNKISPKSL